MTRGEEKAISLNPKETVRDRVTRDKMAVASKILADKMLKQTLSQKNSSLRSATAGAINRTRVMTRRRETGSSALHLASCVKSGEILIQQTDKSGKLAITTREEYVASLQPHIRSDKVITLEEKNEREKILNGHCIRLTRILCVGESHRHEPRVRQAVTNKFCPVPVLSGLLKD